ncbi:hypothetical protein [Curtobacterium flaccumfaciens]|uniref:hypothetical protein n=1 Tax=Curtobacterium flaccumfaciens TaxID=2035 RepID=UPI002658FE47|nr:hypothetical protein [Curtobacterium flaccumfaciens]MCS5507137.1 hypothetical protein [Curtobacterium flaccumfaciens pv. flaccumfaciens]
MSASLAELQAMPDEEIVRQHDEHAKDTVVGIDFFLTELDRRAADRAAAASHAAEQASLKLGRRSFWLAVISAATSVAALIVAVATLIVTS